MVNLKFDACLAVLDGIGGGVECLSRDVLSVIGVTLSEVVYGLAVIVKDIGTVGIMKVDRIHRRNLLRGVERVAHITLRSGLDTVTLAHLCGKVDTDLEPVLL